MKHAGINQREAHFITIHTIFKKNHIYLKKLLAMHATAM